MPKEKIDITPEDSFVKVFLEEPTDEELAELEAAIEAREIAEAAQETIRESAKAKLLALGLTEEELEGLVR